MSERKEKNTGLENAPSGVKDIIFALKDGLQKTLKDKLIGLYLYGSLAYECFNPAISDIDFVVVLSRSLSRTEEQKISELHRILGCESEYGKHLEGTYMTEDQVKSDDYPPDFLYYVEGKEFVKAKAGQGEPDFPMHRQHLHETGLKITGQETQKLFYPVPWNIIEKSLRQEMAFIKKQFQKRPVYAVLNLCRVVRAHETRKLSSKKEGGEWGLQYFPLKFNKIIRTALKGYTHNITKRQKQFLTDNLPRFYDYCAERTPFQ